MMKRIDQATKAFKDLEKQGIKIQVFWTLGRFDESSSFPTRS